MGFMGIDDVESSDNASDFMSLVVEKIRLEIMDHMHTVDNKWNTPGFIDCALVLKKLASDNMKTYFTSGTEWMDLWKTLLGHFSNQENIEKFLSVEDDCNSLSDFVTEMFLINRENV